MDTIDLRSDTVTWPTPDMRKAMAAAEVGDDVYGEDPTVNRLEAMGAAYMGKEAGLFVSSGTMGNLISVLVHCQRGEEVILGHGAHTFRYEVAGVSALGGVQPQTVPIELDGTLAIDNIRAAIRDHTNVHYPRTALIALENTSGHRGGIPLTVEYTRSVRRLADTHNLPIHIDGARIWNAATALDCKVADLAKPADSITFCLSKGLCAPVGSILCGTREFIHQARRVRKMLGGGMRQVGVLAAAGLIALEKMTQRLGEDHENARRLAEGLVNIPGLNVDMEQVQTNMVMPWLADWVEADAPTIAAELDMKYNVRIGPRSSRSFRLVTHYWITPERVDKTIAAFAEVMENATS